MALAAPAPRTAAAGPETLTAEDFETASVHSATPSYVSEVPSYNSALPPPYTVSDTNTANARPPQRTQQRGLPPIPAVRTPTPSLAAFSIPNWPSHPSARHYRSVAQRRVAAASDRIGSPPRRRPDEPDNNRPRSSGRPASAARDAAPTLLGWGPTSGRPLEDPSLVGEDAARRAREERLRRERDEILVLENRRWDWYLTQMNQWQSRERGWSRFGQHMGIEERKSFMRRISGRVFC